MPRGASLSAASVANCLLQLLSVGCSVAITVIVAEKMWVSVPSWSGSGGGARGAWDTFESFWTTGGNNVCLLTTKSVNLCAYSYVVCGISWLLNLLILPAQCMRASRGCRFLEAFAATLGLLWWIAAATVGTVYGTQADDAQYPAQGYRTATWALGWANVGLFALTLLFGLLGGSGAGRAAEGDKVQQAQQAGGGYPTGAYTGSAYAAAPPPGAAAYNPTYTANYPPQPANV